ncbi:MAG: exopolysaccharide biosynthesis protein, partial [Pseudomonadota bacterium]
MSAGIVAGLVFTFLHTPYYRATAKVEILAGGTKVIEELDVLSSNTADIRTFETARQKMLSRDLARRVVFKLNLANNTEFLAPVPEFSFSNILRRITGENARRDVRELSSEERNRLALNLLSQGLSVRLLRNTSLLEVSFSHPKPAFSEQIANQVVRSYIDQGADKRIETSTLARDFIREQVNDAKTALQGSEKELVEYAQENGITTTGT